jgi:arylamine N-acetyltransferase
MRMSLAEWRSQFFRNFFGARKPRPKREPGEKATPRTFTFDLRQAGGKKHVVAAMTRSEARAVLKKQLGLKRLPVGA